MENFQEAKISRRGLIVGAASAAGAAVLASTMFGKRKAVDAEDPSYCNPDMGDVCPVTTDDNGNEVPNTFKPKGEDSVPETTTPDTVPSTEDTVPTTEGTTTTTSTTTSTTTTVPGTTTTSTTIPEATTTQPTYVVVETPTSTTTPPITIVETVPPEAPDTN